MSLNEYKNSKPYILALHIGASNSNAPLAKKKRDLISNALDVGKQALFSSSSGIVNAGCGSNLTVEGSVECEASLMYSQISLSTDKNSSVQFSNLPGFGSVGALSGVTHPIEVAHKIAQTEKSFYSEIGLVAPQMLVGEGAKKYAASHGLEVVDDVRLISPRSKELFQKFSILKEKTNAKIKEDETMKGSSDSNRGIRRYNFEDTDQLKQVDAVKNESFDTVGAICIDWNGKVCAGASTGGILLRDCGRIGDVATFGAGIWAETSPFVLSKEPSNKKVEKRKERKLDQKNSLFEIIENLDSEDDLNLKHRKMNSYDFEDDFGKELKRSELCSKDNELKDTKTKKDTFIDFNQGSEEDNDSEIESSDPLLGVCCCISGCGEEITQTLLSKTIASDIINRSCSSSDPHVNSTNLIKSRIEHSFLSLPPLRRINDEPWKIGSLANSSLSQRQCGVLCLTLNGDKETGCGCFELSSVFTTTSFPFGFVSHLSETPSIVHIASPPTSSKSTFFTSAAHSLPSSLLSQSSSLTSSIPTMEKSKTGQIGCYSIEIGSSRFHFPSS
eukprot:MONOS_551.1-p1 / transcript=MONOS_551.1 / gene=MONOS_551 / organism=Monocercomonoides_exilis_PA203 / gene_product=unspecified product / transcript_product=unspecified product / location=Mono_scaffold00009:7001-9022(+) / protein_length=557 / sequence_SO=supercontig / SO=protein_coding / is_pseudo=false